MESKVDEELPLVTLPQTTETTQTINPLNFVVGDIECTFQDVIDALDPENSPDVDLLLKYFRRIALSLGVSRFKSWFLWTRCYVFGTMNLYEAYDDAIRTWKMVQSNKATLQTLIFELESYGIDYGADALRFRFGIQPVHIPQIGEVTTNPINHPKYKNDDEARKPRKCCTNRTKMIFLCVYICIVMIILIGVTYGFIRCRFL